MWGVARCCLPRSPGQPQHHKYQNRTWWWYTIISTLLGVVISPDVAKFGMALHGAGPKFKIPYPTGFVPSHVRAKFKWRQPSGLGALGFWKFWHRIVGWTSDRIYKSSLMNEKVKYMHLYRASSPSASNALPLPASWRRSPQTNPTARHQRTLRDHVIRVGVSRDMPV